MRSGAEPAVSCREVEKRFYYYEHRTTSLRELFMRLLRREPLQRRRADFSLHSVDLEIGQGEGVALLGPNGSGKSTLLRMIAGIYQPSAGVIETRGKVAAVIELGSGFHYELTGKENIEFYGAVMGLDRKEVADRFDEITAFAGIGDFIEVPVKYYSAGMQARLAFAVSICVEPDVLLIDEVLAVGDREFRAKCMERLEDFRAGGGTLVVVSHDTESLPRLCDRGVWIDSGRIRLIGPLEEVVAAYQDGAGSESTT